LNFNPKADFFKANFDELVIFRLPTLRRRFSARRTSKQRRTLDTLNSQSHALITPLSARRFTSPKPNSTKRRSSTIVHSTRLQTLAAPSSKSVYTSRGPYLMTSQNSAASPTPAGPGRSDLHSMPRRARATSRSPKVSISAGTFLEAPFQQRGKLFRS